MAKSASSMVVVTGFKELDARLRTMPTKLQRKFLKGALRKGGKRLSREVVNILEAEAYDTGTLAKSMKVKANKRSRKSIGVSVMPPRNVLFAKYAQAQQKQRKKAGNATFAKPKADYYPAFVEFGTPTMTAIKPFRRALYDNAAAYRAYFQGDLTQFVNEQQVTLKIDKAQGYTGRRFKK